MPYNPAGLFSLVQSYFASPGTTIRTEQHNPPLEDIASGMSQILLRDGRAPMTGALNMNGFPINNVAVGNSASSVATLAQSMPIGAIIDFGGAAAPAGWVLCYGQALSRAAYPVLFSIVGTAYGAGDGSTTFNIPDCRGRVSAGRDTMGGTSASRLTGLSGGVNGSSIGSVGGSQSHTLTLPQIPRHLHENTLTDPGHDHPAFIPIGDAFASLNAGGTRFTPGRADGRTFFGPTGIVINNGFAGSDLEHNNVQPTIIFNKIMRVSYDV